MGRRRDRHYADSASQFSSRAFPGPVDRQRCDTTDRSPWHRASRAQSLQHLGLSGRSHRPDITKKRRLCGQATSRDPREGQQRGRRSTKQRCSYSAQSSTTLDDHHCRVRTPPGGGALRCVRRCHKQSCARAQRLHGFVSRAPREARGLAGQLPREFRRPRRSRGRGDRRSRGPRVGGDPRPSITKC